ncbi:5'-AMP-activated protein kinase, gamma subunit [Handroanthus impetiginosus]|uniref:5'-AMP-activated protein kinase, gamma subunit n=1 Tax=Handroanthus impetiginosus TaxID=429701 RepID=A0A2G9HYR7_9LAMI|nr:5'-AMP-activated protein kinase, gamma subunit [Handroanthus impetiginosus]
MAVQLLAYEVADLCLGKPPLRSLSASATVGDALAALKSSDENFISVWSCDHHSSKRNLECVCVGKVCIVDVICYLCREENLGSPALALKSPVSVLLSNVKGLVAHVEPSSSLLEAIDLILQGAQNLVVPIKTNSKRKQLPKSSSPTSSISPTIHNGEEFCWLTQEDIIRFLLSSIGLFSPIPTLSIDTLGLISDDYLVVDYHSPASSAIEAISRSLLDQTSVAVVDSEGILIGEISPFTLACWDETVAAAIMTLSAGDLMAYIDCGGPPEEVVRVVEERLKDKNLHGMLEELLNCPYDVELLSPTTPLSRSWCSRCSSYSARMVRGAEAIVCHRWSSLVAVMIQAITHRVNYVWVIEDDSTVVGVVTFANILEVFRDNLESMI